MCGKGKGGVGEGRHELEEEGEAWMGKEEEEMGRRGEGRRGETRGKLWD